MLQLLLGFGCPIAPGRTLGDPLHLAARYGQQDNVELLLDSRADPGTLRSEDLPMLAARRIVPLTALFGISPGGDAVAPRDSTRRHVPIVRPLC